MREIKFRAQTLSGLWVYGLLARRGDDWFISNKLDNPLAFAVRPETVGQFTGLSDSKGVEIYEGDVLKDGKGQHGKVFYSTSSAAFLVNWQMRDGHYETDSCITSGTVIGNIFENPELLG